LNDDNDDHISNDADSYQDPEETLENIEQTRKHVGESTKDSSLATIHAKL